MQMSSPPGGGRNLNPCSARTTMCSGAGLCSQTPARNFTRFYLSSCNPSPALVILLTGSDSKLRRARALALICVFFAALLAAPPVPGGLVITGLFLLSYIASAHRNTRTQRLSLNSSGSGLLGCDRVRVAPRCWVSEHYAVIRLEKCGGNKIIVLSASRQAPGEYRKLLGWVRLARGSRS